MRRFAALYKTLLEKANILPKYYTDELVTAYISNNAKVIFVKQRDMKPKGPTTAIASPLLASHIYSDSKTKISKRGDKISASITFKLNDNCAKIVTSVGDVTFRNDGEIAVTAIPIDSNDGSVKYKITAEGDTSAVEIKYNNKCNVAVP